MSHAIRIVNGSALAFLLAVATAVCDDGESPTELDPQVQRDADAVRAATAYLQDFDDAEPAGYVQVSECKEHPPDGGMGFHYGSFEYYLDGEIDLLKPEIVLYEPRSNGELMLVAVEYAVPFADWQGAEPPRVFGRELKPYDEPQEWQLHAWIWKDNPAGMFEDWNPAVTCEHAG